MDVLSSRVLLRPSDPARSRAFYGEALGLAVYREFGPPEHPGVVFFLGNGLLELSGRSDEPPRGLALWLQVRDVAAEHARLGAAGVPVLRAQAGDTEALERVQDVLGRHLERFGQRNELVVTWAADPGAERPAG